MLVNSIKFGGTSMGNANNILQCINIIKDKLHNKELPIVTVSAVAGITNMLIDITKIVHIQNKFSKVLNILNNIHNIHFDIICKIITNTSTAQNVWSKDFIPLLKKLKIICEGVNMVGDINDRTIARICAFGEKLSSLIMLHACKKVGINAQRIKSETIIKTDNSYPNAELKIKQTVILCKKHIKPLLNNNIIPIVTGFIAKGIGGTITLLGRGGSDYTASILGYALSVGSIEIWTDVDGIMSADPKIVKNAKTWSAVSMDLASEMIYSGAKVLHPNTINLPINNNIPVKVFNTFFPNLPGTKILKDQGHDAQAVTSESGFAIITINNTAIIEYTGFIEKLSHIFSKYNISIDVITTSEISISITIKETSISKNFLSNILQFGTIEIQRKISKICVIGKNITKNSYILNQLLKQIHSNTITIYCMSITNTGNNITFIIDSSKKIETINSFHDIIMI